VNAAVPVNKFPDFVAAMVTKLKRLFPIMGRRRIAAFLARAGLPSRKRGLGTSSSLSIIVPFTPPWYDSKTGTTRSGRTRQ
jgi:hypothetical protein